MRLLVETPDDLLCLDSQRFGQGVEFLLGAARQLSHEASVEID